MNEALKDKVLKGLDCCGKENRDDCKKCPYSEIACCKQELVRNAFVVLKELEHEVYRRGSIIMA